MSAVVALLVVEWSALVVFGISRMPWYHHRIEPVMITIFNKLAAGLERAGRTITRRAR